MTSSRFRWLFLPVIAVLLASCAAPYGGYDDGYAAYAYPAYAYTDDYHAPADGGFVLGGRHRRFRHRFVDDQFGYRFGHQVGGERGGRGARGGHDGGHHH